MAHLWNLQGLTWRELARRTCRKSWDDEVFGQAARLAFYYLFSMFPVFLLLFNCARPVRRSGIYRI